MIILSRKSCLFNINIANYTLFSKPLSNTVNEKKNVIQVVIRSLTIDLNLNKCIGSTITI